LHTVENTDTEFAPHETKKRNFRRIIEGCALALCVLFFVCPLVKCSQDSSLTASGWEIATGTGDLYDKKSGDGNPLVFALVIFPAVLLILAFMDKPFIVLRNVSIVGLAAKIVFLIAVYAKINSGDSKHVFELAGGNWLIVFIYICLVGITKHCAEQDNSPQTETRRKNKAITEKGSFTDTRDGKVYKTVKIGIQTWMAENLNYEAEGSKCYDNNPANGQKYGRLYDWEMAKKACPPGWHLPSDEEWQELVNFAGGKEIAGTELKSASGWNSNGNGTDEFGFAALPGGYGSSDGGFGNVGEYGGWWSATEGIAAYAWNRNMSYSSADVSRDGNGKTILFSVRCVQD
jgi:uncharacterized protein (TIGR02145 family)